VNGSQGLPRRSSATPASPRPGRATAFRSTQPADATGEVAADSVLHAITAPLFCAGTLAVVAAPFTTAWLALGAVFLVVAPWRRRDEATGSARPPLKDKSPRREAGGAAVLWRAQARYSDRFNRAHVSCALSPAELARANDSAAESLAVRDLNRHEARGARLEAQGKASRESLSM
jgi:hypothetical protein